MTKSMMTYADLPIHFFGYALSTTTYILNRVKPKSKLLTPYEYWKMWRPRQVRMHDINDWHSAMMGRGELHMFNFSC
jgi:hypothetical protein